MKSVIMVTYGALLSRLKFGSQVKTTSKRVIVNTSGRPYRRGTWLLCACLLAIVVLVGNSELLLRKATPIWDATNLFGPLFSLVSDHARRGHLLLWNPWINGGSPDFADPQFGTSSPFLLFFALFFPNVLHGFVVYWLALWIFGGIGMLMLCRHLQFPPWGGLIAALGFIASGFYIGHGEHTPMLYSFSYLPWILWRFDLALVRRSYWSMALAGSLWGLSGLGGYPALVILDVLFLFLWGVGRSLLGHGDAAADTDKSTKRRLPFMLVATCVFGFIGVAILSPAYLGFLIYAKGYTSRASGVSFEEAVMALPPQALCTFASPFLYLLNLAPYSIWPESDVSCSSVYSGVLTIPLAAIGLLRWNKWRFWLVLLIAFFTAAAVGHHLPVRGWLYTLIPPTRYFRGSSLFGAYAIFVLCILAAYGSQKVDLARTTNDISARKGFAIVSGVIAAIAFLSFMGTLRTAHLDFATADISARVLLAMWLLVVVVFVVWWQKDISDRLLLFFLVGISVFDATSAIKAGRPTLYSEASASWWKIMASMHGRSLDLLVNGLDRQLFQPDELGRHMQADCNVPLKIPTFASYSGMVNPFFQPYVGDPVLNQLAVGKLRMWFSASPAWLPPSEQSFAEYVKVSHRLGLPPLILHAPDDMLKGSVSTTYQVRRADENWSQSILPVAPAMIELMRYTPNDLSFRYEAPTDGWLLVTDRYARFWNAKVNNRRVDIAGANFIFRGVPVSHGENIVKFEYQPAGYAGLLVLSWGTLIAMIVWGLAKDHADRLKEEIKKRKPTLERWQL